MLVLLILHANPGDSLHPRALAPGRQHGHQLDAEPEQVGERGLAGEGVQQLAAADARRALAVFNTGLDANPVESSGVEQRKDGVERSDAANERAAIDWTAAGSWPAGHAVVPARGVIKTSAGQRQNRYE